MAAGIFGAALDSADADGLVARDDDGRAWPLPVARWLGPATGADERVLARARGPVLDIGCGPGRHVHALTRRGVLALGVDVSPVAVRLARERGAPALEASIFDRIPGAGTWRTALLLDGNIGIGGVPAALLRRAAALLVGDGDVLVEVEAPGAAVGALRLRLEHDGRRSAPFTWARVPADTIAEPAAAAGLTVADAWADDGRRFAQLRRR
jgi:SAM-dependent methyltransferase